MKSSICVFLIALMSLVLTVTAHRNAGLAQHTSLQLRQLKEDSLCPTWYLPVNKSGALWCICNGNTIQGGSVVRCPKRDRVCLTCDEQEGINRDDLNVSMLSIFCMTHNFSAGQSLLALCPYSSHSSNSSDFFMTLPSNLSELNGFMCDFWHREGDLCNSCINNTGPSIFGISGKCLPVNNSPKRWCSFLALELVIPTVIFLFIFIFKIRATTGPLNAFILFCQTFSIIVFLQEQAFADSFGVRALGDVHSTTEAVKMVCTEMLASFYTFWYNVYIWRIIFSVHTNISSIQVIALQYISAFYPFFLVIVTSIVIRLHYTGCRILIFMWRPFQYCKTRLGINWDPMDAIIQCFATFFLLTYTKILAVSYNLLAPTRVYNETDELPYRILSYDASVHFLSRQHLPYFILALSMLAAFCGLPVVLLILYPMKWFQIFLSRTTSVSIREILRTYTEAFTGCYKDRSMPNQRLDCRYFAPLYFLFRVVYLTCIFFLEYNYVWLAFIVVSFSISSLFAIFQPYKSNWLNIVDSIAFALTAVVTLLYTYNIHIAHVPLWIPNCFIGIPLIYFLSFVSFKVYTWIGERWTRHREASAMARDENYEDQMFERENERSPLINPIHNT